MTSDDFVIGEIESAELDMPTWQLRSFYVSLNDAATEKWVSIDRISVKTLRLLARLHGYGIGDFAVLNKTFDELEELGECKK
ncbi:hypothetical protein E2P42_02665 [Candidatus Bathyarchaeota archaeon]|nr:hypothetical protein E2P42_02665 [Candidatus Bathyarchaeota archaeon]